LTSNTLEYKLLLQSPLVWRRSGYGIERRRPVKRIYLVAAGIITGLVGAVLLGQSARSEQAVTAIPSCAYQEVIYATGDGPGYDSPRSAAAEVVDAILDGGGRPDGTDVGDLLEMGDDKLSFYLPDLSTPDEADGYGLIVVAEAPEGGYLPVQARFCEGSIPNPFPWGLEGVGE
jgi:hypothetical protein